MTKIHKTITIHAPVDRVFAFITDPRNLPVIWPSMVEVKNVIPKAGGGYTFDWVYNMAGMHFKGASDTTEIIENKRHATQSTKGIESRFTWNYESRGDETQLTLEVEYKVPVPLVGKFAEAFLTKQNDHEADVMLANLKDKMEIETRVPA